MTCTTTQGRAQTLATGRAKTLFHVDVTRLMPRIDSTDPHSEEAKRYATLPPELVVQAPRSSHRFAVDQDCNVLVRIVDPLLKRSYVRGWKSKGDRQEGSMRPNIRARLAGLITFLLALALVGVSPANANYIVGATGTTACDRLNMHDAYDYRLQYRRAGVSSALSSAVYWVMVNRINPTDLTSVSTSSSSADISIHDGNYTSWCGYNWWTTNSSGTVGAAKCSALIRQECDRHTVAIHQGYIANRSTTIHKRLVCHEIGHTLGITHNHHTSSGLRSCMKNPAASGKTYFSDHEIDDMINFVW